jgi:glycosyltransferase involved in cell wall biosynthesis
MKIAIIGKYGEGDIVPGPERAARELFWELRKKNIDAVFLEYFFKEYEGTTLFKRIFGQNNLNEYNSIKRLGIFPMLLKLFTGKFDIVHLVNAQRFVLFIFLVKPFIKTRLISSFHGLFKDEQRSGNFYISKKFIDLLVEKMMVSRSELLFFPSEILMEKFRGYFDILEKKIKIIPHGISSIFSQTLTSFPPVTDAINIIFYNGFNDSIDRGLHNLYNLLKETEIKIRLYILGNSLPGIHSVGNLEIILTKLKNQEELIRFFDGKHFIVKTPAFDSFSIGTAECMAYGVIPLVTNNTGIRSYINHGVNGFIYGQSPQLNFGLIKILSDISEGKFDLNLISCNAKKIFEELNWTIITAKYIEAYKAAL